MKALAQTNNILSIHFPFTRRRPLKYALLKPQTSVPSTDEFMRVNNATDREGRSHRVWPTEVLRPFQTAEIITELQTQHYVLRDRSITRVARSTTASWSSLAFCSARRARSSAVRSNR